MPSSASSRCRRWRCPASRRPGSYWLVPRSLYGEIRQDAVLLKAGEKNPAAAALLAYLKSDAGPRA